MKYLILVVVEAAEPDKLPMEQVHDMAREDIMLGLEDTDGIDFVSMHTMPIAGIGNLF